MQKVTTTTIIIIIIITMKREWEWIMNYIGNIYIIQSQDHKVLLSSSRKKERKKEKD